MQTPKKTVEKKLKSKEPTDDLLKKPQEEKLKKSIYSVSTPRSYVQKSSAADIYARKPNLATKDHKKSNTTYSTNVPPMKDLLKSSPSSVSHSKRMKEARESNVSLRSENKKITAKASNDSVREKRVSKTYDSARKDENNKNDSVRNKSRSEGKLTKDTVKSKALPFSNVTVNSPISKRKLEATDKKGIDNKKTDVHKRSKDKDIYERQRSNTRTLSEDEVKVLTEVVDNNVEMRNLSHKLIAKPKAFYVELNEEKNSKSQPEKTSEDEASYEDDFESYESDFDSYKSETQSEEQSDKDQNEEDQNEAIEDDGSMNGHDEDDGIASKDIKDDEKMLDSGNFDLRDQRSANKPKAMDFILEATEGVEDKKVSLTDEGFQEMSSSSAVSSMRTVHVDVLDRPLFMDFTKSKENKRKRKIFERLKQRAEDILSMVTLHEMSYVLFEMKPIPYDLYMATFGRSNYNQIAVQTFDDGISEEVQTEDIDSKNMWTQYPVKFSKDEVYISNVFNSNNNEILDIEKYKENPLRRYFEQKDGVGSDEMLPYENYSSRLKNNSYNIMRLRKFLKKVTSKISNILTLNTGNTDLSNLVKTSKFSFSKGYVGISTKKLDDEKLTFLHQSKISGVVFSESKNNLLMTIHKKSSSGLLSHKCILCLWNLSVARREPLKLLVATDQVEIGRFKGNTDGIFIAALEDGTLHLWDLSEEPTYCGDVVNEGKSTKVVDISSERLTQTENDREWNVKNRNVSYENPKPQCKLQASAYTSSARNMVRHDPLDCIVGLQFIGGSDLSQNDRRVVGQICTLQRIGIITIWSIIQDKSKSTDIGKAYWSKMKLEVTQSISLIEHLNVPTKIESFNLNTAKKRLSCRRQEKNNLNSRPKSAITRNERVASARSKISTKITDNWETGVVCNDMKVININGKDSFLIAKNCGEVVCCTRYAGGVKVKKFCVANDISSITCLEVSPHGLPYFLTATDSGTINVCCALDIRVLLTLDCRNGPPTTLERCQSDHKGRYIGTVATENNASDPFLSKLKVDQVIWSPADPFCIIARHNTTVSVWELTRSDIHAHTTSDAALCVASDQAMALLTPDDEVQVYRLEKKTDSLDLFQKYITLL